ncbi:FMN-dependent NADH-azoreductase [Ilumatobacter nonamiensis]|uniref:FMN-dependent NADH-azoreductase n=1 Tax=Ilumatobacter nonamiensis TaxID=467093 RepID=UPI000344FEC6|nr:NAD(P)H-dependent oxidoreductase [Ilumatobacter nonamiensis]
MTSILWVEGSPKGERSLSSSCARAFLETLESEVDDVEITHLDVWSDEIVAFGREAALAKLGPLFGEPHTPEQAAIWEQVTAQIDQVARHDALVISSPMWNWNIPHALKAWIDVVVQPLQSFTLDAEGRHVGVIGVGKRAQLILTRSSAYDGRSPEMEDHQEPYLRYLFDLIGFDVAESVIVEPTTAWTTEEREATAADGVERSRVAGRGFARELSPD